MRLVIIAVAAYAYAPSLLFAQAGKVAPISVCEALADRLKLNGAKVAIVGKFVPGDMPDGDTALIADHCPSNVVTEDDTLGATRRSFTWPNRIPLANFRPTTAPLDVDQEALAQRLRVMEAATERSCYERRRLNQATRKSELKRWRYQWAIAYGTFTTRTDLHVSRGRPELPGFTPANGFGLMNASPAYLWLGDHKVEVLGDREPCPD